MKWYLVVRCDNTVRNPLIVGKEDLFGFDEWDFTYGQLIKNWNENIWFKAEKKEDDGIPDDVLQNALGLPIFSSRLRETLEQREIEGIQYLPVRILESNGTEIKGFSIVNILNLIPCLDWEKSVYCPKKGNLIEVRSISKMVLKTEAIKGSDVFRLKEFKLNIIVSERFKEIFEEGKFTGYSFHERILS